MFSVLADLNPATKNSAAIPLKPIDTSKFPIFYFGSDFRLNQQTMLQTMQRFEISINIVF